MCNISDVVSVKGTSLSVVTNDARILQPCLLGFSRASFAKDFYCGASGCTLC